VRAHRGAVPDSFAGAIPLEAHQKAADYTVAKVRVGIVDVVLDAAVLLLLTFGGVLQLLSDFWGRQMTTGSLAHGTALILSVFLLQGALGIPLDLYRTFGVEARFGFNKMTWKLYAVDLLKSLALRGFRCCWSSSG
jgi:STE24 endopeptidase